MHRVILHQKAREAIKAFPDDVRYRVGRAIFLLQQGETLQMPLSKVMSSLAKGASELRIKGKDGIYRIFYLVKSEKGVFVFHAFMKKTQKTPLLEITLARVRLRELING